MEPILCEWDEDEEDYVPVSDPDNIESIVDSAISDAIKNANTVDDSVRNDADKWITVHPHGGTGTPALIGEDGTVKAGMGGKFNGKNIKDAHGTERFTSGETNAETEARNKPKPENKLFGSEERDQTSKALSATEKVKRPKGFSDTQFQILKDTILSWNKNPNSHEKYREQLEYKSSDNSASGEVAREALKILGFSKTTPEIAPTEPVTVRPEPENRHVEFKIPKTEHKIPEGHERPHSVSGISGYQSAMRAEKESAHHEFGTEAPLPLDDFSIIKETDKAYAIHNPHYDPQPSGYYGRHRAAKGESFDNDKYIWIPKGHATTEGEGDKKQIASLSSWIAKEKGISTHESNKRNAEIEKTKSELQSSANDRYTKLVEHAKQSGIKGARSGMRTSTLLEKYKEAGIEPPKEYQEGGLKEIAQSAPETKYRDIPGRGKGVVLNVPFAEKEAAKEHGARWSPDLKKWYFPEGTDFPEDLKQYRHDSLTRADAESDYSDEEVESMNTENLSPKDLIVYHLRKLANQ